MFCPRGTLFMWMYVKNFQLLFLKEFSNVFKGYSRMIKYWETTWSSKQNLLSLAFKFRLKHHSNILNWKYAIFYFWSLKCTWNLFLKKEDKTIYFILINIGTWYHNTFNVNSDKAYKYSDQILHQTTHQQIRVVYNP